MAKTPTEIKSLARSHTISMLRTLTSIANSKKAPPAARVSAATAVLDRGWGKPIQGVELGADDTITKIIRKIVDPSD